MAWHGLHLTRGARLTLADQQLVIAQEETALRVALEDIAWILVDTPQVTLSTALISACMEAGCVIVITAACGRPRDRPPVGAAPRLFPAHLCGNRH